MITLIPEDRPWSPSWSSFVGSCLALGSRIYNGNLPDDQARSARVALMMFNDVILRTAFHWGLSVIDLRLVCSEPSDYANPIEPSGSGGAKIARAIAATLAWAQDDHSSIHVFAGKEALKQTAASTQIES